jgi:four helix bundle protein
MTPQELRNRSMQFGVRAVQFCRTLPDTWESRRIGEQLIDSSTSTAMNYRAAGRGRSRRDGEGQGSAISRSPDSSSGGLP